MRFQTFFVFLFVLVSVTAHAFGPPSTMGHLEVDHLSEKKLRIVLQLPLTAAYSLTSTKVIPTQKKETDEFVQKLFLETLAKSPLQSGSETCEYGAPIGVIGEGAIRIQTNTTCPSEPVSLKLNLPFLKRLEKNFLLSVRVIFHSIIRDYTLTDYTTEFSCFTQKGDLARESGRRFLLKKKKVEFSSIRLELPVLLVYTLFFLGISVLFFIKKLRNRFFPIASVVVLLVLNSQTHTWFIEEFQLGEKLSLTDYFYFLSALIPQLAILFAFLFFTPLLVNRIVSNVRSK